MTPLLPTSVLVDFVGSLSILVVLSVAFGALRRRFATGINAQIILGGLFGIVAVLQMHAPLSPTEGLIVDLRNIPIALAGAFLGWRGLTICLIVAASARLEIGGVGTYAGLAAMGLAGLAGVVWAHLRDKHARAGLGSLVVLAIAMSVHLGAVIFLPNDAVTWFLNNAAPSLLILNLICVPIVGYFLDRETRMIREEQRMLAAAANCPDTGMLTGAPFLREVSLRLAANPCGTYGGLMIIRLRHHEFLSRLWGKAVFLQILGALRHRIADASSSVELFGLTDDHAIVVPLSRFDILDIDTLSRRINRAVRQEGFKLPSGQSAPVSVGIEAIPLETLTQFQDALQTLFEKDKRQTTRKWIPRSHTLKTLAYLNRLAKDRLPKSDPLRKNEILLFEKAELLFAARER